MNLGYILVVDDEPEIRRLVQEVLEDEHYKVITAENAEAARAIYENQRPDLVLLDIWMPGTDGITLLKEWAQDTSGPDAPVVMMSGHGTVETAVEATRLGAYDFIEKPVSMAKLLVTVERALQSETLRRENVRLRRAAEPDTFLIGKSRVMVQLRDDMERVAASDAWVLIQGEPGSGRAMAARYLHAKSARRERPFVEVGLAAGSAQNISLKLFGGESGAINPGAIEHAADGTLVLNDIGELTPPVQVQLLNALQEKRFQRGGAGESVAVAARIIAVAEPRLAQAVAEGRFREDLYYRLNVVPLSLPPLREHREDVPELVNFYIDWTADNEHLPYRRFTTAALNSLRNYSWPGNLRELKNVVQRLLILNRGDEVTDTEVEHALGGVGRPIGAEHMPPAMFELPLRAARDQFEKAYLEHHLTRTSGNVAEVARLSEMERTHLYRKLKHLGINPKSIKE